MCRPLIFSFLLGICAMPSRAQWLHFRLLDEQPEWFAGTVTAVEKDRTGYIWFGTPTGLIRYDGQNYKSYYHDPSNPKSPRHSSISWLYTDVKGQLWVGYMQGGVARYDAQRDAFVHYTFCYSDTGKVLIGTMYYIAEDRENRLYIRDVDYATGCYDPATDRFEWIDPLNEQQDEQYPGPNKKPVVHWDSQGRIWYLDLTGPANQLVVRDPQTGEDRKLPMIAAWVNGIAEYPAGTFWILTWGRGLYRYDWDSEEIHSYRHQPEDPHSIPHDVVRDVCVSGEGDLWIGTSKGLCRLSSEAVLRYPGNSRVEQLFNNASGTLIDHTVMDIDRDEADRMWVTSRSGGLMYHDPKGLPYRILRRYDETLMTYYDLDGSGMVEGSGGDQWWMGTHAIYCLNSRSQKSAVFPLGTGTGQSLFPAEIELISVGPDSTLIIQHTTKDICVIQMRNGAIDHYPYKSQPKPPIGILSSLTDRDGSIWASTYHGLLRYRKGGNVLEFDTIIPDFDGRQLIQDNDGMIWLGSWNNGVARIDPKSLDYEIIDPDNGVLRGMRGDDNRFLALRPNGEIWTSNSEGIFSWDPDQSNFQERTSQSVPLRLVQSRAFDREGYMWATTGEGLFRWDPDADKSLLFDEHYGLPAAMYYGVTVDRNGLLYVSSSAGILIINPDSLPQPRNAERIVFHSVYAENRDSSFTRHILGVDQIRLSYRENLLRIAFSLFNYSQTGRLRTEYRLVGGSNTWTNLEEETDITFLDLAPGKYRLELRTRDATGETGPEYGLDILIRPPWWASTLAYWAYALFLLAAIVSYNAWRVYALKKRQRELEGEVARATETIREEKNRSEQLLLNILPSDIAEELKAKGKAEARQYDQVSILFSDFVGFTEMAARLSAAELVDEIDHCFQAFDRITEQFELEKIKTIGDAYMAAGGLPDPNRGKPEQVIKAALAMQEFIALRKKERLAQGQEAFSMRIGIHTGPVVAGIVGTRKFQYDIWGNTVNMASRMESAGESGRVNISKATWSLLNRQPGWIWVERGQIPVKGVGEVEMYFVEAGQR